MDRNSDLGDAFAMLPGMGAYATAPSYLDTEDSHAQQLLRPDLSMTTGSVSNTAKVTVEMEGLDGMFGSGMGDVVDVGVNTPMQDRDSLQQLGPKGPITALSAQRQTHLIPAVQPQRIGGKRYEQTGVAAALAASRGKAPAQVQQHKTMVTVRTNEGETAKAPKTAREEGNEIRGLAALVTEMQQSFLPGIGSLGAEEKRDVAEQGAVAAWWATLKAKAASARAGWQKERAHQARMQKFDAVATECDCQARLEQQNARDAEQLAKAAGAVSYQMARQDPEVAQSVAQTFVAMEAQQAEALNIDGLLGLGADEIRAAKANMRRGDRQVIQNGRRSSPMIVENNNDSALSFAEREEIQRSRQSRIMDDKMRQMHQLAKRGRGRVVNRGNGIQAPIPVLNIEDPSRNGQRRGVMEWLQNVFGTKNPTPVFAHNQRQVRSPNGGEMLSPAAEARAFPMATVDQAELSENRNSGALAGFPSLTSPLVLGGLALGALWFLNRKK